MDYRKLARYAETAILFAPRYASEAQRIYDDLSMQQPEKIIYLITTPDIICPTKVSHYESYIIVGIECPLHFFENALYYKKILPYDLKEAVASHNGPFHIDKIYSEYQAGKETGITDENTVLIVTESQDILDFYTYKYEDILSASPALTVKNRVEYLLRENIAASKLHSKKLFGVIFTSKAYEDTADLLCSKIASKARAYKIFLKDINYERLISIDMLDCIVLVDCPMFPCNIKTHIPIVSPFTINTWLANNWSGEYSKNLVSTSDSVEIVSLGQAAELIEAREYKGVPFSNEGVEETNIHMGQAGIASRYSNEK